MPVEYLSDEEASAYGRFGGPPPRAELERAFSLDDADRALIAGHRGEYNRLGFALQLTTVRSLGLFLADPLEVPGVALGYLASQLEIADASCVARYTERCTTRYEHAEEIKRSCGLRDFAEVAREFEEWVDARAWTTGDEPKAIFNDAIGWLLNAACCCRGSRRSRGCSRVCVTRRPSACGTRLPGCSGHAVPAARAFADSPGRWAVLGS